MNRGFHKNLGGPGGNVYMSEHLDKTVNALSLDSERPHSILTHVMLVHQKLQSFSSLAADSTLGSTAPKCLTL
jgi:hypothetical protein